MVEGVAERVMVEVVVGDGVSEPLNVEVRPIKASSLEMTITPMAKLVTAMQISPIRRKAAHFRVVVDCFCTIA